MIRSDILYKRYPAPNGQFSSVDYYQQYYYNNSSNSLRKPNGRLDLKPQPHQMIRDKIVSVYYIPNPNGETPYDYMPALNANSSRNDKFPPNWDTSGCSNVALAKWNGRIHYGGASLGITIAQWSQANSMILDRFGKLNRLLSGAERRLERNLRTKSGRRRFKRDRALGRNPRYTRTTRDPLANQVLEYEFGWQPLVEDLKKVTTSLFQHAVPDDYVRASHQVVITDKRFTDYITQNSQEDWFSVQRCTISANVKIENPNLWAANRAGLINLPGILWDAIPWSFLVGMFVNINQLLGSLSNEVGLDITDRSTTWTFKSIYAVENGIRRSTSPPSWAYSGQKLYYKERVRYVGAFPPVTLQWRCPDLNPELILIASALAVQRFNNISKLLDLTYAVTRRR